MSNLVVTIMMAKIKVGIKMVGMMMMTKMMEGMMMLVKMMVEMMMEG